MRSLRSPRPRSTARYDAATCAPPTKHPHTAGDVTVNACLTTLASVAGASVTTARGLGSSSTSFHAVQGTPQGAHPCAFVHATHFAPAHPTTCVHNKRRHRRGHCHTPWQSVWLLHPRHGGCMCCCPAPCCQGPRCGLPSGAGGSTRRQPVPMHRLQAHSRCVQGG